MITLPMQHAVTSSAFTMEHVASVTSKGQITIPADVRRFLRIGKHGKIAIAVGSDGRVELKAPKYPTVESIMGAVKPLGKIPTMPELREAIADDFVDRYLAKYGK